jgi:putative aldouronate transport system permease protein
MPVVRGDRLKYNPGEVVFDVFNHILLGVFALACILPFLYVIAGSLASNYEFRTRAFFIVPRTFNIQSYIYIFSSDTLVRSMLVSVYRTVLGTIVSMTLTLTMAYPLTRKDLWGRNFVLGGVVFCMLFSGGMVPTFLVVRSLKIFNTIWALVLPNAIVITSLIVVKTFFQSLPAGLEEAAEIDGCNDLQVFLRIVLPLSMPVIATFSLFYAVWQWNSFFDALIYINDTKLWPLQVVLRQMIMMSQVALGEGREIDPFMGSIPEDGMKMAVIVVSTIPILMVYPFLQKYFTKGALIGAIKG